MRLLKYLGTAAACLVCSTAALPKPSELFRRGNNGPFVGPPTRQQRLQEGWVDEDAKYFHEPGGDDILGHYDMRFFKGAVSYEERSETLHHMIRAYLSFFYDKGLETWIAHGTLLGWWWNGKILPWDWDIDTQVTGETLHYMAKHLNNTKHKYYAPDTTNREYLLDVNPMSWERVRGDGMNIIDARWIDTKNGLYIDITGLSETHPDINPGIVSCKNNHDYRTRDLYPMRESMFEGVPAKIPYAYDKLLIDEYQQKALTVTEYEGHVWNPIRNMWTRKPAPSDGHYKEPLNSARKRSVAQS